MCKLFVHAGAGQHQGLKVVFVATECGPWSKVGGLADVLAALPPALAARGHEVLTVVPRYAPYEGVEPTGISVPLDLPPPSEQPPPKPELGSGEPVPPGPAASGTAARVAAGPREVQSPGGVSGAAGETGGAEPAAMEEGSGSEEEGAADSGAAGLPQHVDLWACEQGGVQRVFVDHPLFASTDIYGGTAGGGKGVYTYLEADEHPDLELRSGQLNQMRSALLAADCLVTVSRGYAAEVQREGPMSCGMHDILAARGISGIMNGIDTAEWDPATDTHLPELGRYTAASVARGKARMKAWLQERLGLEVNPDAPLIGFVGRLTQQKGVDVLLAAAPALLAGATAQPPAPTRWRPPAAVEPAAAAGGAPCAEQTGEEAGSSEGGAPMAVEEGGSSSDGGSSSASSSSGAGRLPRGSSGRPAATGSSGLPAAPAPRRVATAHVAAGVSNARRSSHLEVPAGGPPSREPGMQFVLLGTGDHWMEMALLGLSQSFPRQAAGLTTFSEELAHWIMAASDFVLVPSRFEPCGLVAQAAVRYGAVPIVCAVGGLKDLVAPEIGYVLPAFSLDGTAADHRQDAQQLIAVVRQAAADYGSARYLEMQQRGMALDVSWERPAAEWEQLLQRMAASAAEGAAGPQAAA
ncbi:hypothetical protein ABPG75_001252 [Micractinium tetrahymenae]